MTDPVRRPAYPDLDEQVSREVLGQLDEAGMCAEHWKILITAGMGRSTMTKGATGKGPEGPLTRRKG